MSKVKLIGWMIISLFSFCSYSHAYERVIKNQSDKTWVIVNVPFESGRYSKFDSNGHTPKVCSPTQNRLSNVCVLSPGSTTYIDYVWGGELLFIEQNQNVKVTYNISHKPSVWGSNNPVISIYNDDITIS